MSKKKAGGSVRQQANRVGKRLGLKISGGQTVHSGDVLIRQRGTTFHAGDGVRLGRDHTLYAVQDGKVIFGKKAGTSIVLVQ